METQFQYIVDQAKQYKSYSDNPGVLIDAINNLPQNVIYDIHNEYGSSDNKFQPVNLLRAEIARLLLNGTTVTEQVIEKVKEHIRQKDKSYFIGLSKEFLIIIGLISLERQISEVIGVGWRCFQFINTHSTCHKWKLILL